MAREKEPWEHDGKRYTASLQDVTDKQCYKDFFESDTFEAAKQACDEAAEKHQRSAIVFDRKAPGITHRKVIQSVAVKEEVKTPSPPPRRGRKKVENPVTEVPVERKVEESKPKSKKKVITKDDYF